MSDEYKDRYIIIALLKSPPRYYRQYKRLHSGSQRFETRGGSSYDITKDLPCTYSRSTAETAMNSIGQSVQVISLHLEGTS